MHFFWFILLIYFISNPIYPMEPTQPAAICYLAQVPSDIQQHIVTYLSLDVPTYETDNVFKKRLEKMDYCPIAATNISVDLGENRKVSINKSGSLVFSQKKKFHTQKETIIASNTDVGLFKSLTNIYKSVVNHSFTPQNQIMEFVLSSNKKIIASVIHFDKIQLHSSITKKMLAEISLQEYNNKQGSLQSTSEAQITEFSSRGYIHSLEFEPYGRTAKSYLPKNSQDTHTWYNPIRALAVSNNGQLIGVANDHQLFLIRLNENNKDWQKIYETPLKHLPPNAIDLTGLRKGNIRGLIFNRQNTKLGILYNDFYQLLPDKDSQIAASLTDTDTYMKYALIQILQFLDLTQKEQLEVEFIKELPPPIFLEKLLPIIEDKDNKPTILKKEILPLVEDNLTLAAWFKKMGVCKKWEDQCTGWHNYISH